MPYTGLAALAPVFACLLANNSDDSRVNGLVIPCVQLLSVNVTLSEALRNALSVEFDSEYDNEVRMHLPAIFCIRRSGLLSHVCRCAASTDCTCAGLTE